MGEKGVPRLELQFQTMSNEDAFTVSLSPPLILLCAWGASSPHPLTLTACISFVLSVGPDTWVASDGDGAPTSWDTSWPTARAGHWRKKGWAEKRPRAGVKMLFLVLHSNHCKTFLSAPFPSTTCFPWSVAKRPACCLQDPQWRRLP